MVGNFITTSLVSFSITFLILPVVIKATHRRNRIPPMGGLGIFAMLALFFMTSYSKHENAQLIFGCLSVLFIVAVLDDLRPIPAIWRLLFEFCLFTYLIYTGGFRFYQVPLTEWSGFLVLMELFAAVFFYLFLVNALNFIDGIDGLAGMVVAFITVFAGFWLFYVGDLFYAALASVLLGAIVAFLFFNWKRAKIYLGDSGILLAAVIICILLSRITQLNGLLNDHHFLKIDKPYLLILGLVFFPVADALRVVFIRISNRKSPLIGDFNHLHYRLLARFKSPEKVVFLIGTINAVVFGFFYLAQNQLPETVVIIGAIAIWAITLRVVNWVIPLRKKKPIETNR